MNNFLQNLKKKIVDLNFKVHNTYTLAVIMDVVINIYADMLVSKGGRHVGLKGWLLLGHGRRHSYIHVSVAPILASPLQCPLM